MVMEAPEMPELKEVEGEIVSCIVFLVRRLLLGYWCAVHLVDG